MDQPVNYSEDSVAIFAAEVSEVSDRPLRDCVGRFVRGFFQSFDTGSDIKYFFSPGARLVDGLVAPGEVLAGADKIVGWFKSKRGPGQQTAHNLLLVDRGRVTCYVTHFWTAGSDADGKPLFRERREVYIIDLDEGLRIKRFEKRYHKNDAITRYGSSEAMEAAAEEVENNGMKMRERF
ncbi:hypothetical protein LY76DRAFT_111267 [Colletotrichum caudatum]|nr:hypothetical protein LY76DRAFT_111267 [Colletotrichum caudatum]